MTERCEMWSISAGRVVNRFPCALSILRLVQEPISRGSDSWKKSKFKPVCLGHPALHSGIQIADFPVFKSLKKVHSPNVCYSGHYLNTRPELRLFQFCQVNIKHPIQYLHGYIVNQGINKLLLLHNLYIVNQWINTLLLLHYLYSGPKHFPQFSQKPFHNGVCRIVLWHPCLC